MGHVYEQWWWIKEVPSKLPTVWHRLCRWCPCYNWGHRGSFSESQSHQVICLIKTKTVSKSRCEVFTTCSHCSHSVANSRGHSVLHLCFVLMISKGHHIWKNVVFYIRSIKRRHCLHPDGFGLSHWHVILSGTMWVGAWEFLKLLNYNKYRKIPI